MANGNGVPARKPVSVQDVEPQPKSLYERIRGKRTRDIRLPMSADSVRDPRLPKATPMQDIQENAERVRDILRPRKGARRTGKRNGNGRTSNRA